MLIMCTSCSNNGGSSQCKTDKTETNTIEDNDREEMMGSLGHDYISVPNFIYKDSYGSTGLKFYILDRFGEKIKYDSYEKYDEFITPAFWLGLIWDDMYSELLNYFSAQYMGDGKDPEVIVPDLIFDCFLNNVKTVQEYDALINVQLSSKYKTALITSLNKSIEYIQSECNFVKMETNTRGNNAYGLIPKNSSGLVNRALIVSFEKDYKNGYLYGYVRFEKNIIVKNIR